MRPPADQALARRIAYDESRTCTCVVTTAPDKRSGVSRWRPSPNHGIVRNSSSSHDRIEHAGQIIDLPIAHELKTPSPDGLPHRTRGIATDRWREVHVHPTVLVHRLAGAEGIAGEGELDRRIVRRAVDVPAIDDPGLLGMQLQSERPKPFSDPTQCIYNCAGCNPRSRATTGTPSLTARSNACCLNSTLNRCRFALPSAYFLVILPRIAILNRSSECP